MWLLNQVWRLGKKPIKLDKNNMKKSSSRKSDLLQIRVAAFLFASVWFDNNLSSAKKTEIQNKILEDLFKI